VWLLWVQYFLITYPWYFYITWLSTYIREQHGITNELTSALYAIFPLLFGGIGCFVSGMTLPAIAKVTGGTRNARRVVGTSGFIGAGLFMLLCIQQHDPLYAMLAMGMASFCNDIVMPCAWGSCMDIGGRYAGTLSGSMNMFGNFAGFVAPQVGGIILDATRGSAHPNGDYGMFMYTMAGAYFLGAFCWPFIDPTRRIDQDEQHDA
jgi:MFS transporter, ACS family, glucarate transporter